LSDTYGRRNKFRSVVDMMKQLKANAVPAWLRQN